MSSLELQICETVLNDWLVKETCKRHITSTVSCYWLRICYCTIAMQNQLAQTCLTPCYQHSYSLKGQAFTFLNGTTCKPSYCWSPDSLSQLPNLWDYRSQGCTAPYICMRERPYKIVPIAGVQKSYSLIPLIKLHSQSTKSFPLQVCCSEEPWSLEIVGSMTPCRVGARTGFCRKHVRTLSWLLLSGSAVMQYICNRSFCTCCFLEKIS